MATSGESIVSVYGNQVKLRFAWWQSGNQDVANNRTTIGWELQLITTNGSISSSMSRSWSVTVNGNNYSGSSSLGNIGTNTTKGLASGTTTIPHNADGSKSFSYSFSRQFEINYSGNWIGTVSGSGNGTLNTIPRASSVSATNGNIGESISISINRASSSFKHTLKYSFNNLSGTIAEGVTTSKSWTLPTSFYAQIPNAKSSWGRIICETYSGSTKIGSSECRFDVYVKESTNKPGISATVKDINNTTKALTGDENKLIKYYSKAQFSITSSPKNSASTKSINVKYNGTTYTGGSGNSWTGNFSNVVTGRYDCSVTDTRGFTSSVTVNKTLIEYIKLTCTMEVGNPTAAGECHIKVSGNYFNGSFGATNNTLTVQYRLKTNDGSYGNWITLANTLSGNTYSIDKTISGLDYQNKYTFQARAVDKLATVNTNEKSVKSTPIFDWGANDFHFHVPVSINGNEVFHSGNCTTSADSICRTWRYPNGMQVSIVKVSGTWNITEAWGSVYSSPWISGQSFNIAFSEAPKVTINAYNANSAIMVCQCSGPTTTATGACYLWKPTSQSGIKTYIEYIAIGRWK